MEAGPQATPVIPCASVLGLPVYRGHPSYTNAPLYKDYLSTEATPVIPMCLCTRTTCLQRPPQLYQCAYVLGLPVYRGHPSYTNAPLYKDYLSTEATPVIPMHLCTRTTCLQRPPQLYQCASVQGLPVYRGHPSYTNATVHKDYLSTEATPVIPMQLRTRTNCLQRPVQLGPRVAFSEKL